MTDLQSLMPDQELILEAAVDQISTDSSNLTDEIVLDTEIAKPALLTDQSALIRSTEIQQPIEKVTEIFSKETNSSSIATQGIIESITNPIQNFINNFTSKTFNFLTGESTKITESEKIIKGGISEILNNSEQIYEQSLEANVRQTDSLIEKTQNVVREVSESSVLEKESVKETLDKVTDRVKASEATTSTILEKAVNSKAAEAEDPTSIITGSDSGILGLFKERESELTKLSEMNSSSTNSKESNVTLKSNKLVESSEVRNLVTPDKTLEKSVTVLSQALPEAVNNLSTSVTSISPSTVNNTSTVSEGARIDQSSSTVINQGQPNATPVESSTNTNQPNAQPNQMNEYYLQAIYAALMSGKIKVKLETY